MFDQRLSHLDELRNLAEEILDDAVCLIQQARKREITPSAVSGTDVKLLLDVEIQDFICSKLTEKTGIPALGEEGFCGLPLKSKCFWVVDPIDGSFNVWSGIPVAATSVALVFRSQPVIGVIRDLFSDECVSSSEGNGVFFCGKKSDLQAKKLKPESTGLVLMGITSDLVERRGGLIDYLLEGVENHRKVRMLGSACISLLYFATGRCAAVDFRGIYFWDIAAGYAISRELGCCPSWSCYDEHRWVGNFNVCW